MRYLEIADYEIDLVKTFLFVVMPLVLIGTAVWYFALREPPALDIKPNTASAYDPTQGNFTYPFTDNAMREAFASQAVTYNDGAQVLADYPTQLGSFPGGLGLPTKMFVWFPEGALDAANDYSFTDNGYRYYRGIIVPGDDPAAFERIRSQFAAGSQNQSADPFVKANAVALAFKEGTEPPANTEYALVYGLYYWTTYYLNENAPVGLPSFLVGSYEPIQQSAVSDPPDNILPQNTVLRRGDLTMTMRRVEFGARYTRVLFTVHNSSAANVDWSWSDGAFVVADDTSYNPVPFTASDAPKDILPSDFPPELTTGYMIFPRLTVPQQKFSINLPLPSSEGASGRWTQAFNLRNVTSTEKATNGVIQTPAGALGSSPS
jgi:hypothetical protein